MTDQPRDEVNRYARLGPFAQALVDDHDAIALAEMLVKADDDLERARRELADRDAADSADAAAGSYALRAEGVEARLAAVTALYEQWVKAGPPPLGVPTARWWDRRLVEFQDAIRPAAEQPRTTPNNPPGSTREQLPDAVLALLPDKPYLSTACDTAQQLDEVPLRVGGTSSRRSGVNIAWLAGPMHGRCRLNHKFTGALCICPCHQHAGA